MNKPTIEEILAPKPEAKPRIPPCRAVTLTEVYALHTMIALMSPIKGGIYDKSDYSQCG